MVPPLCRPPAGRFSASRRRSPLPRTICLQSGGNCIKRDAIGAPAPSRVVPAATVLASWSRAEAVLDCGAMDLGLAGKTCIVTGAGRGIGRETARQLCADGAAVLLVGSC